MELQLTQPAFALPVLQYQIFPVLLVDLHSKELQEFLVPLELFEHLLLFVPNTSWAPRRLGLGLGLGHTLG